MRILAQLEEAAITFKSGDKVEVYSKPWDEYYPAKVQGPGRKTGTLVIEWDEPGNPPETVPVGYVRFPITKPKATAVEKIKKSVAGKAAPTGKSAVAAGNWFKKMFGAVSINSHNSSNPYSDSQVLNYLIKGKRSAKAIVDTLTEQGWTVTSKLTTKKSSYEARHADGGRVFISDADKSQSASGKAYTHISVYGEKKAKPTTIPYYD